MPGAGACSRAMPLPAISTSRPALPACSIISRIGSPMSEGTRNRSASAITMVFAGGDETGFDDFGGDSVDAVGEG